MGVKCIVCEKLFSTQFNLNKHTRKVHNLKPKLVSYDQSKWNYKCLEQNCNSSFHHNIGLREHLSNDHDFKIETETLEFLNKDEFFAWKQVIEKTNKSNYTVARTSKHKNKAITYYLCNRSGKQRSNISAGNKRLPKKQGSCKLNSHCISMITLIEGKNVVVTWIKTHYGHNPDLQHLRLPKIDKFLIASKLALGVPPSRILDSYRDKVAEDINREGLITRKDIQNIKNSYDINISEGVKHDNEGVEDDMYKLCSVDIEMNCYPEIKYTETQSQENDSEIKPTSAEKTNVLRKNFSEKVMSTMTKLQNTDNSVLDEEQILQIQCHLDLIDKLLDLPTTSSQAITSINPNEPEHKKNNKVVSEILDIGKSIKNNFSDLYISHSATDDHKYF